MLLLCGCFRCSVIRRPPRHALPAELLTAGSLWRLQGSLRALCATAGPASPGRAAPGPRPLPVSSGPLERAGGHPTHRSRQRLFCAFPGSAFISHFSFYFFPELSSSLLDGALPSAQALFRSLPVPRRPSPGTRAEGCLPRQRPPTGPASLGTSVSGPQVPFHGCVHPLGSGLSLSSFTAEGRRPSSTGRGWQVGSPARKPLSPEASERPARAGLVPVLQPRCWLNPEPGCRPSRGPQHLFWVLGRRAGASAQLRKFLSHRVDKVSLSSSVLRERLTSNKL